MIPTGYDPGRDADGATSVYRLPGRVYGPATMRVVLTDRGYAVEGVWADLRGTAYAEESVGVVARRPPDDESRPPEPGAGEPPRQ